MSISDNKQTAQRFIDEILNTGDWSHADRIFSNEVVMHHPSSPEPVRGLAAVSGALGAFRTAFPDLHLTVEDAAGDGDNVALMWIAAGTNTGDMYGTPPTGKPMRVRGFSWLRFANGKIVEDTIGEDTIGMLQQLGLAPASA
jgi:steroid delta-isomerase-like uncharacterized protein